MTHIPFDENFRCLYEGCMKRDKKIRNVFVVNVEYDTATIILVFFYNVYSQDIDELLKIYTIQKFPMIYVLYVHRKFVIEQK